MTAQPVATSGTERAGNGELLSSFGLLVVGILVAALATTSLILASVLRRELGGRVAEHAPALMSLLTQDVREALREQSPDRLNRVVSDATRLPHVQRCQVTLAGRDGTGATFHANRPGSAPDAGLNLRAEITSDDGAALATLEVGYDALQLPALPGMLGTAAGTVAVAALGVFWLGYRTVREQVRPITRVRDNLLAYHSGQERSLDLLMMQDTSGRVGQAWNGLLEFVRGLQRELDEYQSRAALLNSAQLVNARSSRAILDALPVGVLRIDGEERLAYANGAAMQLLGLRGFGDATPLAGCVADAALRTRLLALRENPASGHVDLRTECGAGHSVLRLTPISAAGEGELVVLVQDVSQLKEAERSREEFLDHITHELRTPLTNIRAYTETLTEDFFDDEQTRRECYNVIMSETRRLSKLIEDVLSASQIEAGAARLHRVAVRIDQSLRAVVQEMQAAADAKSLELTLKLPSKLPPVGGDRHRLHQVWTNLIGNAVKYTPTGGSITVDAAVEGGLVRVRISDTGIGIAAECHEKIFEKFFRVNDPAVEAEQGTGLGLSLTRDIVRIHGGSIRVDSEPGKGSTFTVELPLARETERGESQEAADGVHSHR